MSKTVPFQIIQFIISSQFKCKFGLIVKKHFYFELFSLVKQFFLAKVFSNSIETIDRILSGATIPCKIGPGSNGNEGVLDIHKIPTSLEPHHQIV